MGPRRSGRLGLVLALLLLTGLAWLGTPLGAGDLEAQNRATLQATRDVGSERELRVDLQYAAGSFSLTPAAPGRLYQLRAHFDEESQRVTHRYRDGHLEIETEMEGSTRLRGGLRGVSEQSELHLRLGDRVPTRLFLELGAVQGELELGGIPLRHLEFTTGASDTQLQISRPNPVEMDRAVFTVGAASFQARGLGHLHAREIKVDAGVGDVRLELDGLRRDRTRLDLSLGLGNLEIAVPEEVGIRLVRNGFLVSMDAPGLVRSGNVWESPRWEEAQRSVEIHLDAALGSVSVERLRP
ncbi:MAG: hypothetical protein EA422_01770 [Gemmatimonadales bacterium]|nr:MAG: hypothetical protein EA422_01770 [Gemmatimonadales bacterium]